MGFADTVRPKACMCFSVRCLISSATAVSGMMGGPYSSESSSCNRHRGCRAVGSCTIWQISGRFVPISTSLRHNRSPISLCNIRHGVENHCHHQCCYVGSMPTYAMLTEAYMQQWSLYSSYTDLMLNLKPRKASKRLLLPSDWPPIATISGIGRDSPCATAAACRRLRSQQDAG